MGQVIDSSGRLNIPYIEKQQKLSYLLEVKFVEINVRQISFPRHNSAHSIASSQKQISIQNLIEDNSCNFELFKDKF